MSEDKQLSTRDGLHLTWRGAVMGTLADAWLRAAPGVNILLWMLALAAVTGLLARRQAGAWGWSGQWLAVPALFFSAGFAWRDSPTLRALDALALLLCLGLAAGADGKQGRFAARGRDGLRAGRIRSVLSRPSAGCDWCSRTSAGASCRAAARPRGAWPRSALASPWRCRRCCSSAASSRPPTRSSAACCRKRSTWTSAACSPTWN